MAGKFAPDAPADQAVGFQVGLGDKLPAPLELPAQTRPLLLFNDEAASLPGKAAGEVQQLFHHLPTKRMFGFDPSPSGRVGFSQTATHRVLTIRLSTRGTTEK